MGIHKINPEGGSGGKRGHSNMDQHMFNDELKRAAKRWRRLNSKDTISEQLSDADKDKSYIESN